jgi:hypothetical protein
MRKALNENPVVQLGLLGVLGLVVAVVLMMQMGGGSSTTSTPTPTTPATTAAAPAGADASAAGPATPSLATPAASATPSATEVPAGTPTGAFEAGKGLPSSLVDAYKAGDVVVLLVVQDKGIEDKPVEREVESLRNMEDTTVFVTDAKHVSKYSRVVQGVQLDRVPAIVALKPLAPKAKGNVSGLPEATITYGFRGPDSVKQVVGDAEYKGTVRGYDPG